MDSTSDRLEFLDLSTATEAEKEYIEKILFGGNSIEASASSQAPNSDAAVQWSGQHFAGDEREEAGAGARPPIYPAPPCYVYYMTPYPSIPAGQFPYPNEMETQSPPQHNQQHYQFQQQMHLQQQRPVVPRSVRKNEKKQEQLQQQQQQQQQQNYVAPIQVLPVQYSSVFQPSPFFHFGPPVYSEFHPNFMTNVEHATPANNGPPVAVQLPAIAPAPAPVVPPVVPAVAAPVVAQAPAVATPATFLEPEAIVTTISSSIEQLTVANDFQTHVAPPHQPDCTKIPEFHPRDHMCYEETVTLKAPKKKLPETVEILTEVPDESLPEDEPDVAAGEVTKSWAGLFKEKPLARVLPFDSSASAVKLERPAVAVSGSNHNSLADDPFIIRLSEYLKGYQLDHRASNIIPRGLINHSNWCYVNAILQALMACPPFLNLLRGLPTPQTPEQAARIPITAAMVELVQTYASAVFGMRKKWEKHGRDEEVPTAPNFEPKGVYRVLEKVRSDSGYAMDGRQEDAEEFLSCLLNGLNDEMLEILKLNEGERAESSPPLRESQEQREQEDELQSQQDDWKTILRRNKKAITRRAVCSGSTPVSDIFRGQLRSHVQRAGDDASDSVQPFFTLQLDVEKTQSVKDALELLIGKDPLEGVTCTKTNKEVEAWTSSSIEELPPILVLHLKCFDYKQDGCSKITKVVQFPIDLKIDPKLISLNSRNKYQIKQRSYKLVAVVYHDGKEATKGHYLTDAYHVGLGAWIRYDDGNVKRVGTDQVLSPQSPRVPYLLHYRRSDTMASTFNRPSY